jgi:hypothetical protein
MYTLTQEDIKAIRNGATHRHRDNPYIFYKKNETGFLTAHIDSMSGRMTFWRVWGNHSPEWAVEL